MSLMCSQTLALYGRTMRGRTTAKCSHAGHMLCNSPVATITNRMLQSRFALASVLSMKLTLNMFSSFHMGMVGMLMSIGGAGTNRKARS